MREAGDEIWYVLRHADKVTAEDIMNASSGDFLACDVRVSILSSWS